MTLKEMKNMNQFSWLKKKGGKLSLNFSTKFQTVRGEWGQYVCTTICLCMCMIELNVTTDHTLPYYCGRMTWNIREFNFLKSFFFNYES